MTAEDPDDEERLESWLTNRGFRVTSDGRLEGDADQIEPEDDDPESWLARRGFRDVSDWGGFPTQVTGRIPPDWHWFYFRERSGRASIEIFPPDRYPFALPGSDAVSGFDPTALVQPPQTVWTSVCETPGNLGNEWQTANALIVQFIDRWKRGEPAS